MLTVSKIPGETIPETFPADGSLRDKLEYVARYAEYGPELFGSRPWKLAVTDSGIDVLTTPDPRLRKVDFDGRESIIAAGSAVFLLRLALRCHLLQPEIRYTRDFKQPSLLARLEIVGRANPSPVELELFSLLTGESGEAVRVPPIDVLAPDFQELVAAAREEGVRLRYVENEFLRSLTASMLQSGDKLYYQRDEERTAFRRWLGVRTECPAPSSDFIVWSVFPSEVAEFGAAAPAEAETTPAVGVICTRRDDEQSWLNTGQALGRIQLLSLALGMRINVFNQPLQAPGMRARFARETGFCNFPQVVIQIGYEPNSTAVRRGVREGALSHGDEDCGCGCGGDCKGDDDESSDRS